VYVAEVLIIAGYRHRGRVECVRLGVRCQLWVASLAIHGVQLTDLETSHWPWVRAIDRFWQRITAWSHRHVW
jgi:hypothetical protein